MKLLKNKALIDGRWVDASGGGVFAVVNPATQENLGDVPDMGKEETLLAIAAASKAFKDWSSQMPAKRAEILKNWAKYIEEEVESLAVLLTSEQGKPKGEAVSEIMSCVATLRWCAEEGCRLYGEYIEGPRAGTKIIISRHPMGVVGAITPWNFPASMVVRKIAPALAAGCTVILKPAEATPLTALALGELALRAGLPAGVFNIVSTSNPKLVGEVLTSDVRVRKISFTGSTRTGKILMKQAAENIQKLSLELGGNAPFIVFPSADLDKAVTGAMASKFRNAGQTCICANRIFVHEDIYEAFLDRFVKAVGKLVVGNGLGKDVSIGPLINIQAIEKIEQMIDLAKKAGAEVLIGGKRHVLGKTYFEPTVITGVPLSCSLATEEIFGPVAVLYPFKTEEEVIALANDTPYGLSSYIYSENMGQIWRVSDALEFGMVGVNEPFLANDLAPFGGIKESGIGKEGGKYGVMEHTNVKYRLWG